MPKLSDHGLGGGGKGLGVPVYPLNYESGLQEDENGSFYYAFGEAMTDSPVRMYGTGSCSIGDDIYYIGTPDDATACYKYNVKSKMWTNFATSPAKGSKPWAVPYGNLVIYGNGANSEIYSYDITSDTHALYLTAPTTYRLEGSRADIDGDNLYVFGGSYNTTTKSLAYRFNLIDKTATKLTDLPSANYEIGVKNGEDGGIYLFGGSNYSTVAYKYNIASNTYTTLEELPSYYTKGVTVKYHNYILLINSTTNGWGKNIFAYSIVEVTYIKIGTSTIERSGGYGNLIGDTIYLNGGVSTSAIYKTGESMDCIMGVTKDIYNIHLLKNTKMYVDGAVYARTGSGKYINGSLIIEGDIIETSNGVLSVDNDGDYTIVDTNYITIEG